MSTSITVRNVPDHVRDELAARAALTGRSLQEYLLSRMVDLAARPDVEAFLAKVRERKERTGSVLSPEAILAHREADHR
jgi:plasmid stability protein